MKKDQKINQNQDFHQQADYFDDYLAKEEK